MGGRDWLVRSISPREFSMVVEPGSGLVTAHEGQLYISVFLHPTRASNETHQLESFVKRVLQTEGDLFAFKLRDGVEGSILSAVVEYCDNDMSLRAVTRFQNLVIDVSIQS